MEWPKAALRQAAPLPSVDGARPTAGRRVTGQAACALAFRPRASAPRYGGEPTWVGGGTVASGVAAGARVSVAPFG